MNPEVLVANGRMWESTGNNQKAMESYIKALEKQADYSDALTAIARLHFRQGNHKQAADFFGRAIKQNPNDAGLFNDLGLALSKMGNHQAAQQTLGRALELAPGTSRYANNLASVKFEAGDKDGAYKVLEANNKPAVAHFNMAYLYYKSGSLQDAQGHLANVMKFAPMAQQDASVKQAVERAREMLNQLNGAPGPQAAIAQATTIPSAKGPAGGVRQTSQAAEANAKSNVAPAAGPTVNPMTQTPKPATQQAPLPKATTAIPPAAQAATKPDASNASKPSAKPDSSDEFMLPPSFQMPTE